MRSTTYFLICIPMFVPLVSRLIHRQIHFLLQPILMSSCQSPHYTYTFCKSSIRTVLNNLPDLHPILLFVRVPKNQTCWLSCLHSKWLYPFWVTIIVQTSPLVLLKFLYDLNSTDVHLLIIRQSTHTSSLLSRSDLHIYTHRSRIFTINFGDLISSLSDTVPMSYDWGSYEGYKSLIPLLLSFPWPFHCRLFQPPPGPLSPWDFWFTSFCHKVLLLQ